MVKINMMNYSTSAQIYMFLATKLNENKGFRIPNFNNKQILCIILLLMFTMVFYNLPVDLDFDPN